MVGISNESIPLELSTKLSFCEAVHTHVMLHTNQWFQNHLWTSRKFVLSTSKRRLYLHFRRQNHYVNCHYEDLIDIHHHNIQPWSIFIFLVEQTKILGTLKICEVFSCYEWNNLPIFNITCKENDFFLSSWWM